MGYDVPLSPELTAWKRRKLSKDLQHRNIILDGAWRPSDDHVEVGENFVTMENFYYGDKHPVPVPGMTKITSAIPSATGASDTKFLCHADSLPLVDTMGTHTITNTDVTLDTLNPKFGDGCMAFNGVSSKLSIAAHTDFNFHDGNCRIDFWANVTAIMGSGGKFVAVVVDSNNYILIGLDSTIIAGVVGLHVNFIVGGAEKIPTYGLVTPWQGVGGYSGYNNQWTHIRFVENGDNAYLFVNGVLKNSDTITGSARMPDSNASIYVGANQAGSTALGNGLYGLLDELIIAHDGDEHTDAFDPPTAPYIGVNTINTPYIYAAHQYINDRFGEAVLLAQCANEDESASYIIENTTSVPSSGNFSSTIMYELTEDKGIFSKAPNNNVLFCNGVKNLIWGGSEVVPVGIINKASDGSFDYNVTDKLTNSINDAANSASIHNIATSIDTVNMLTVMHGENNDDDEILDRVTTSTNIVYSRTIKALGSYSINFKRRNSAKIVISTLDGYDLSNTDFCIARYVRIKDKTGYNPLFYQYTTGSEASDYMLFTIDAGVPKFTIVAGSATKVTLTGNPLKADKWYFLAVVCDDSADTYYMIAGLVGDKVSVVDHVESETDRPATYNSNIFIGTDKSSGGNFANCFMDEIIDAKSTLINIPSDALKDTLISWDMSLGSLTDDNNLGRTGHIYVISDRPIEGIKPYIRTSNEQVQFIKFTAGEIEIEAGDTIIFGTTGGTAKVLNVLLTSGSWAGDDAEGYLTITEPTATPEASETIQKYVADGDETVLTDCATTDDPTELDDLTPSIVGYVWGESGWENLGTLTDGTADSGIPLVNTGWITFASTVATARQSMQHGVKAYHYKFVLSNISDTTELYQLSLRAPVQEITDIWDGEGIQLQKVWKFDYNSGNSRYKDYTVNAAVQDYQPFPVFITGSSGPMQVAFRITYVDISQFTSNDELIIGCQQRLSGVIVYMADKINSTKNTTTYGLYFNGKDWEYLSNYKDGTMREGTSKAFSQTGYITWDSPDETEEFKTRVKDEPYLYYYKIKTSATLDEYSQIDCLMGIPAEKTIRPYKFPVGAGDVVYLCNNMNDRKNAVRPAATNTATVWKEEILVGTERALTCGACIPNDMLTKSTLMFKNTETWALMGRYPKIQTVQLSDTDGCPAPKSLVTTTLPIDIANKLGVNAGVAIWQGTKGVYISDGRTPIPIHYAIRAYFDTHRIDVVDLCIEPSMIDDSIAWMDSRNWRYHIRVAAGWGATNLNTELVFDLRKMEWSKIKRGNDNDLQYALEVEDSYGNPYQYGFKDDGYMERLDYGKSFDGEDIICKLRLGDLALHGNDPWFETNCESIDVLMTQKETTTNKLQIVHYLDSGIVGKDLTENDVNCPGRRLTMVHRNVNRQGTYHGIEMSLTTDDESYGFEPLGIILNYSVIR